MVKDHRKNITLMIATLSNVAVRMIHRARATTIEGLDEVEEVNGEF